MKHKGAAKRHYLLLKSWQRSCRNHPVRSRCRHARSERSKGQRMKGGK